MAGLVRLPDAELCVMQALWALTAPAPTGAIREELCKGKDWNLSAVQTLLGRLTQRGFVARETVGRQWAYTPLVPAGDYLAFENRPFFKGTQGGALSGLVAALYESNSVTASELAELRGYLDRISDETKE